MGCYATRDPKTVSRLPGVVRVITDKERLAEELAPFGVREWPTGIRRFDGHRRAFVKVQDGCLLNCTFCIIPSVRPRLASRGADEIVEEVAGLVSAGYQEIVLTGIHLGHYGIDLSKGHPKSEWCRLWHLLERLNDLPGAFRIRLSSLEAAEVRDDLVAALARLPRLVPHLHLCLQSGSDRVLARMKRRYTSAGFLRRCERIRQVLDQPAFTTDVIVGFPGETEDDFQQTLHVCRESGFAKIHVFSYSPRAGTPAAVFTDRVPAPIVAERRQRLVMMERELADTYRRSLVGKELGVLVEGESPQQAGFGQGTSCRFVPVAFPGYSPTLLGRLVRVRVERVDPTVLMGNPVAYETADISQGRIGLPLSGFPLRGVFPWNDTAATLQ